VWQVGILKVNRILGYIENHAGVSAAGHVAHNALLADFQLMTASQHRSSTVAVGSAKNGKCTACIIQEDAGMVKVELIRYQANRIVQQGGRVFDGRRLYEVQARVAEASAEVTVPSGRYMASRISVRVFERGRELADTTFSLWLAEDAKRTPVLIEAELPIGSARVELTGQP